MPDQKTVRKNDILTLSISDMGSGGEGVGHADGYTLFVRGAVPGDIIEAKVLKAKKHYGYGKLLNILTPSPDRQDAPCPAAGKCGGCQLQSLSYPAQLAMKEARVRSALTRIGSLAGSGNPLPIRPIIGAPDPLRYRSKAQIPVGEDRDGNAIAGFYGVHSHRIVPCVDCLLQPEELRDIIRIVLSWMSRYHIPAYNEETGKGLIRHILFRKGFRTGEILTGLVVNRPDLPEAPPLVEALRSVPGTVGILCNSNARRTNVILGKQTRLLWGSDHLRERIGDLTFRISLPSFFQVNPIQTERLYRTALEFADLSGNETVFDLYCGTGSISLFLAQKAKNVCGVEIIPEAIEDAKRNASLNGISNVEFYAGAAEEIVPRLLAARKIHADVIVVDPPRKGCDASLLRTILVHRPGKIVYVSCDPATLARDLHILSEGGYETRIVQPVDMFPQTSHVETVALMQ